MRIKKLKKQIIFSDKFILKNIDIMMGFLSDETEENTLDIEDAMYFSTYDEAENFRKTLRYPEDYKVIIKHEKHKK